MSQRGPHGRHARFCDTQHLRINCSPPDGIEVHRRVNPAVCRGNGYLFFFCHMNKDIVGQSLFSMKTVH